MKSYVGTFGVRAGNQAGVAGNQAGVARAVVHVLSRNFLPGVPVDTEVGTEQSIHLTLDLFAISISAKAACKARTLLLQPATFHLFRPCEIAFLSHFLVSLRSVFVGLICRTSQTGAARCGRVMEPLRAGSDAGPLALETTPSSKPSSVTTGLPDVPPLIASSVSSARLRA